LEIARQLREQRYDVVAVLLSRRGGDYLCLLPCLRLTHAILASNERLDYSPLHVTRLRALVQHLSGEADLSALARWALVRMVIVPLAIVVPLASVSRLYARAAWRRARASTGALALALAAATLLSGCQARSSREPHDVVLIVVDTLRADHLALYGYPRATSPHLDELARDAVTYEQAISPGTWTVPAHASLFTGRWPSYHGAERAAGTRNLATPINPDVPTLAEILRTRGFHTAAFVANSAYLCQQLGFDRGFDEFVIRSLDVAEEATHALKMAARRQRLFFFLNILDPHEPYEPPPPYDTLFPGKDERYGTVMTKLVFGGTPITPEMQAHFVSQYDGEVAVSDAAVGRVLSKLKALGRYDQALIVVTGDHGDLLGEHGLAGHGTLPFEGLVHVPLVVKYPGAWRAGTRVPGRVSTLGIFGTILSSAGLPYPAGTQVRTLDVVHDVWVEDVTPTGERLRVGYDGQYKIVSLASADRASTQLYDLAADPEELHLLADDAAAEPLRAALARFAEDARPINPAPPPVVDPEREWKLRVLGYVE